MSLKVLLLSYAVDASKGRVVVVTDIPDACRNVDMDNIVHMRLDGNLVKNLLSSNVIYGSSCKLLH